MNTKHTPSPWIRKGDWIQGMPESGASQGIAQILGNCGCAKTVEANARLISAAPDLLQVVEDYLLLCQLHDYVGAVPDAARSAIAKAKGEA
jgi:hypothetical protein